MNSGADTNGLFVSLVISDFLHDSGIARLQRSVGMRQESVLDRRVSIAQK